MKWGAGFHGRAPLPAGWARGPGWGHAPALHYSLPAGNEPQLEEVSRPAILEPMTRGNPVYAGMEGTICSRT